METTAQEATNTTTSGLDRNCAICNRILLLRTRACQLISLRSDTKHLLNIKHIIFEKLKHLEIDESHFICHPCWKKVDRHAKVYTAPTLPKDIPKCNKKLKCASCAINIIRSKRHILKDDTILLKVQQHVSPLLVTSNDFLCDPCFTLFSNADPTRSDEPIVTNRSVCLICGRSLKQLTRYCTLGSGNNPHILSIVHEWVQPREVHSSDIVCYRCFQRADSTAVNAVLNKTTATPASNVPDTIILPNYSRASLTQSRCIFIDCKRKLPLKTVSFDIRAKLFKDFNFYVPRSCRICTYHLETQPWTELLEAENINRRFTAAFIEDFCKFMKK